MEVPHIKSMETRRDHTGGIVRDKLDLLMDEMRRQSVPPHLITLAEELQAALNEMSGNGDADR